MTIHGPILGEFGSAQVLFPSPRHRVPPMLRTEFELLLFTNRPASELEGWIRRLEADLGITGVHRRAALHADRKSKGLKARGDPEEIDALLRQNVPIKEVANRMGLQRSYVQWRAKQLRADERENNMDASVPKFAHDDSHVSAVRAGGGFRALAFSTPATRYLARHA
jgi:hypothetical protein